MSSPAGLNANKKIKRDALAGPLIASQEFFKGQNDTSLANVQWVYLAVGE
jgi:hypothetical protein